jgi:hypothetical protein
MGKRLFVLACGLVLIVGLLTGTAVAEREPHGLFCSLTGKASFDKGLSDEARPTDYKFTGTLSDCRSSDDTLESGKVVAEGSGDLSCAYGTSEGTAKITWNNGETTEVSFSTTSLAAVVHVEDEVTKSSEPATAKGDKGHGLLQFHADPQECSSDTGVKQATFDGAIGSGGG